MIINEEIEINIKLRSDIEYYNSLGYNIPGYGRFIIKTKDLKRSLQIKIDVKCDSCGKELQTNFDNYFKSCGLKEYSCKQCKTKKTNLERYGVENTFQDKDRVKEGMMKKHGVENSMFLESTKDKIKNTNLENIGIDNPFRNKERIKECTINKLGVSNVMFLEETKDKIKNVMLERYGVENSMFLEETKDKIKNTNLERYGVEHPFQNEDIQNKIKITNLERFGVENPFQNKEIIDIIRDKKKEKTISKYKKLINLERYKIIDYNIDCFIIYDMNYDKTFEISFGCLYDRIRLGLEISLIQNPLNSFYTSSKHIEISNFLNSLNIKHESNNRTILNGKELDIFIPSKNIAIEFNGLYWHTELFKKYDYHQNKSLECLEKSIQLIHVWEDEWLYKKEIIKSIILDKLGIHNTILYARKTIIKEVSSKEAMIFLNNNHIQGGCGSNIKLGLYYNNELVSLMTFGKNKKEYELLRFCNKINTKIIGGASKIFEYFKRNYEYNTINSYSDLSISHGKLYEILGFKFSHLTKPNYYWVNHTKRYHRFNFNKKKLIKDGFDHNMTEKEIMYDRGYYRLFGCGQMKWVYSKHL